VHRQTPRLRYRSRALGVEQGKYVRQHRQVDCRPTPTLIERATLIHVAGNTPEEIGEFAGRVSFGYRNLSVACMASPEGSVLEVSLRACSSDTVHRDSE
jgi:hypothetical protein